ncbi:MAG: Roadblock/LC7 family protein [Candidatus Bathyarchaeota archaeon B26-2]|nr:MAG: Roadblock/LC7 family protein [Candidatus Bathyarchaeota archaeon B26-2]
MNDLRRVGGINASAAVTRDGLLIASDVMGEIDAETFAAMTATMTGAAETAMSEVKAGNIQRVIVEGESGKMVSIGAGPNALLVVLTVPDAPLGLLLLKIGEASRKIAKLLG